VFQSPFPLSASGWGSVSAGCVAWIAGLLILCGRERGGKEGIRWRILLFSVEEKCLDRRHLSVLVILRRTFRGRTQLLSLPQKFLESSKNRGPRLLLISRAVAALGGCYCSCQYPHVDLPFVSVAKWGQWYLRILQPLPYSCICPFHSKSLNRRSQAVFDADSWEPRIRSTSNVGWVSLRRSEMSTSRASSAAVAWVLGMRLLQRLDGTAPSTTSAQSEISVSRPCHKNDAIAASLSAQPDRHAKEQDRSSRSQGSFDSIPQCQVIRSRPRCNHYWRGQTEKWKAQRSWREIIISTVASAVGFRHKLGRRPADQWWSCGRQRKAEAGISRVERKSAVICSEKESSQFELSCCATEARGDEWDDLTASRAQAADRRMDCGAWKHLLFWRDGWWEPEDDVRVDCISHV